MFQDVFNYKPKEQDYRIWLVLNPATWLVPILMSVFLLGILIHAFLFSVSPYSEYWVADAAPAVEAAPAPAAAPAE
ncbi:light-harvesting antenna LH1, alpha subunit [Halochromatium glycolicum]|jgi:light-harvesting protein B-800-850 alpha chain|uniref:Light-harvesting protein n=1 Tax=Halochromatium glycolicum TaxID=85075 RepID=A0AAJ0U3X4_9GAMM|nr:light-harvesting antenna LH1, alpha subunit [Halochromatium glycolicum]MBK1704816.1 light-harvesting protein [Halochromatium glycolicum]